MSEQDKTASVANASQFGIGVLRPGTVQVTVSEQVTQADLHNIIDKVIIQHGCLPCGLAGIDLVIRPQDPRIIKAFEDIPAVKEVTVYR